uniref:MAPEG family protein n=1 Tax=Alexandrium catenella TaxID=2925 RepID=A0A7S1RNH9_ALECA
MVVAGLAGMEAPVKAATVGTVVLWFLNFFAHVRSANPANYNQSYSAELSPSEKPFNAYERAAANMVESLPLAIAVIWASIFAGGNPKVLAIVITLFVILRVLFVVLYTNMIQPFRSVSFALGQLCVLIIGVLGILGAFDVYS